MEKYLIAPPSNWVTETDTGLSASKDTSAPYYFILVDYQEQILPDKICRYKRTIEKINDESRIEDASLYITELNDEYHQIVFHVIDLIRDGKRFSVLDKENISVTQRETSLENHITNRINTVSLSIDDLRVGDIVDYQATTIDYASEHPLEGKFYHSTFWLTWNCTVLRQKIRIINQSGKDIQAQYCNMENNKPVSITEVFANNQTITKDYIDLSSQLIDDSAPGWLWPDFMLVTTVAEWPELSDYLYNYYATRGVFDDEISLDEIQGIDPNDSTEVKIIKIIRFVQNDIRYKGENHGVFTHTPKKSGLTLRKRYGDCKDKTNLLVAFLKCIGVDAHLTLVNTDYGQKISQLSPSPYHFNHMIAQFEFNGKEYYFDATIKKQSGDLDHSASLDYGYGLVLTDNGQQIKKLPYDIEQDIFVLKHVFDFSKNTTDNNTLKISRVFFANRANNMRYYLNSKDKSVLADEYLKYAKDETDLEFSIDTPLHIISDDSQSNRLETEEIYIINGLTDNDDNKQLQLPTNIYLEFPTTVNRHHPLGIDLNGVITHNIEIIYKGNSPAATEEKTIKNKWFSYRDKINTKDNTIYLSATATPHKRYVETKDLDTYTDDVEKLRLRSVNNFTYKSDNHSFVHKIGSKMLVGAVVFFVIILVMKKFN